MRHRGILTIGVSIAAVLLSLYAIYSQVGASGRHQGLGSLLNSGTGAEGGELQDSARQMVIDALIDTSEWALAQGFVQGKGFQLDPTNFRAYQFRLDSEVLSILRAASGVSADGSVAEVILVLDLGNVVSAWVVITNLPQETVMDGETPVSSVPVLAWSNGRPIFYVYFYHLVGGLWVPYNYWWHNAQSHPNWYYSVYNYWWWYYDWYDYDWFFSYDWFFGWYYNIRFHYWSTYFPMPEASPLISLVSLPVIVFPWAMHRRRRARRR